ncbi:c2H2-type domain-containing protein [Nephila pilipes]|uniref:C2H2-type domain-containing protein n=1 Tax=Nephila pilipes TaxID=299642 RepID=A0A8X6IHA5_NEPPI|nr:c2H2-type domain-containing protein [Nephila pilipes]
MSIVSHSCKRVFQPHGIVLVEEYVSQSIEMTSYFRWKLVPKRTLFDVMLSSIRRNSSSIAAIETKLLLTSVATTIEGESEMSYPGYYECYYCHRILMNQVDRYNHTCFGKREVGFICDYCRRIFRTRFPFVQHLMRHNSLL